MNTGWNVIILYSYGASRLLIGSHRHINAVHGLAGISVWHIDHGEEREFASYGSASITDSCRFVAGHFTP